MSHPWVIKVRPAKDGGWYCRLIRGNRRTVWHTETYRRRRDAVATANNIAPALGARVEVAP